MIEKIQGKKKKIKGKFKYQWESLVWAERIKKKSAPGKFYKQSVQNIAYFNKERTFSIRKKKKIDKIYYWLKNLQTNRNLTKRFQRTELCAMKNNFSTRSLNSIM